MDNFCTLPSQQSLVVSTLTSLPQGAAVPFAHQAAPSFAPVGPPSSHSASVVLAPEGEKSYTLILIALILILPTAERTPDVEFPPIMICIFELSTNLGRSATGALGKSAEINSE